MVPKPVVFILVLFPTLKTISIQKNVYSLFPETNTRKHISTYISSYSRRHSWDSSGFGLWGPDFPILNRKSGIQGQSMCLQLELRPTGTLVRPKNPSSLGLKIRVLPHRSLKIATWEGITLVCKYLSSSYQCLSFSDHVSEPDSVSPQHFHSCLSLNR